MPSLPSSNLSQPQSELPLTFTPALILLAEAILVALTVCAVIHIDARVLEGQVAEGSLTSNVQLLFLAIIIASFSWVANKVPSQRGFAILVAGFFSTMFVRELDQFFDLIYHGFWKVPAITIAAIAITYAIRHRDTTTEPLARYFQHQSFGMMATAMVGLLVTSRLVGMGDLWQDLMAEHYVREVKNLVEESGELVAYAWIMLAASRYCREQLQKNRSQPH